MEITFNIPDEHLSTVIDAICAVHGYQEFVGELDQEPQPNPETKAQFAKRMVGQFFVNCVKQHLGTQAAEAARLTAVEEASQIEIT